MLYITFFLESIPTLPKPTAPSQTCESLLGSHCCHQNDRSGALGIRRCELLKHLEHWVHGIVAHPGELVAIAVKYFQASARHCCSILTELPPPVAQGCNGLARFHHTIRLHEWFYHLHSPLVNLASNPAWLWCLTQPQTSACKSCSSLCSNPERRLWTDTPVAVHSRTQCHCSSPLLRWKASFLAMETAQRSTLHFSKRFASETGPSSLLQCLRLIGCRKHGLKKMVKSRVYDD